MTLLSRNQFHGLPYDEPILPGATGLGDKGWPTHVAFTIGVTQSKVAIAFGAEGALSPEVALLPFLGKAASIGWQLQEVLLGSTGTPKTTYSFTFEMYIPFGQYVGPNAGYPKHFIQVMDGVTKRWGLRITKYTPPGFFDPYYEGLSNLVGLVDGNGTLLSGGTYALGTAAQYKFEILVKETAPTVTVRIYKLVSNVYSLVHTMTGNPTSTAAKEWQYGNFEGDPSIGTDQYNVFFPNGWPGTMNTRIKNIATFSTSDGDGAFGGATGYTLPKPRTVEWSVYDAVHNTEVPIPPPKIFKASTNTELDMTSVWDNPMLFRGRTETWNETLVNYDGTSYGSDPLQKYQIYTPYGVPTPPGGWPVVAFVMVGYYSVGNWSDFYTNYYIMLRHILNMGCAAAGIGVRVGELVSSWLFGQFRPAVFPTAIFDAKLAVRHMVDHASESGINPAKIYTGGHSSGGSIGLCAMLTRNMTDNSHGTNLTLTSNGFPGVVDPPIAGSIVLDAPTNFRKTWDEDPCFPKASLPWQLYGVPGGNARAAISMYNGGTVTDQTIDTTQIEIADWVAVAPHLRPVLYIASKGDTVVPAHNGTNLKTAYEARAGAPACEYFDMGWVKHDFMTAMPPAETMKTWLHQQGAI
jgi:acetyl esterase/lipase